MLSETKVKPQAHLLIFVIAAFFCAAFWWAEQAILDEVTHGEGRVIPSGKIQVVQSLDGGVVTEISVDEGDIVKQGSPLLQIDDTRFASTFKETKSQQYHLQARVARLQAEVDQRVFIIPNNINIEQKEFMLRESALFRSRKQKLTAQREVLEKKQEQQQHEVNELTGKRQHLENRLKLTEEELDISRPLLKKGAISKVNLIRLEREVSKFKSELDNNKLGLPRLKSAIAETSKKIEEQQKRFTAEALEEFNISMAELAGVTESLTGLQDRVTRTKVVSPVKGTIKKINVNTIGGVVKPGMELVEIVPLDESLLIEAKIRPADIAFLYPGQEVMVKLTAYDFTIYGGLKAKLERISADTVIDESGERFYNVTVRTNKNYLLVKGEQRPIIPGMTAVIDILTGHKTVLDYILKPILKAKQNALRER